MKLIATTDADGINVLLDAMVCNPRYDVPNRVDIPAGKYQIAILPIADAIIVGSFHQVKWDRVCIDDIEPPYYVMPLLSGWRIQVHIGDTINLYSSNGRELKEEPKLADILKELSTMERDSIFETIWRGGNNACYITDVVMLSGVDLSDQPFADRYEAMQHIKLPNSIKIVPVRILDTREEFDDFISDKSSAVIRQGNSSTIVSVYPE